jgi:membrane protein DedA with SNARE-associated domain
MHTFIETVLEIARRLGYTGIVVFMLLESSFFPFPSEIVMIPAGVLSAQEKMNPWLAILMGIVGSWLGALLNYYLAVWLGRPFLSKFGKYILLPDHRLAKVERFFNVHGEISTFTGRLIPGVRQYISFPAGLARMNLFRFLLFTGLGAGIWVTVLVFIGYFAGEQLASVSPETIDALWSQYKWPVTTGLFLFCLVLIIIYAFWHRRRNRTA